MIDLSFRFTISGIMRNERELQAARQCIADNLARWEKDRDNLATLIATRLHHSYGLGFCPDGR